MINVSTIYSTTRETLTFTDPTDSYLQNMSTEMDNLTKPVQPTAPEYIVYTATMFYIMIFVVGIIGNLLVVSVIVLSRSMKTSINMYLVNLCVADLLVMMVCMPTALAEIFTMEAWLFGEAMCKLVPFLENAVANASILTISAITIERYRVVKYPLSGIEEDFSKVKVIIVVIWITAIVSSIPCLSIAVYRGSELVDGTPIMVCRNPIRLDWQRIYIVTLAVLFFLLPCLTLFVLYFKLCTMLLSAKTFKRSDEITSERMLSYKDRKRLRGQVINIIGFIVIIFVVCHLPLRVTGLWLIFENKNVIFQLGLEKYLNLLFSTRIMFYMNHAFNPIVYNLVSTKFRNALKQLYFKKFRRNRFHSLMSSRKNYNPNSNRAGSRRNHLKVDNEIKLNLYPSTVVSSRQEGNNSGAVKDSNVGEQLVEKEYQLPESNAKGYEVSLDIEEEKVAVVFRFDQVPQRRNTVVLSSRCTKRPEAVRTRLEQ